MTANFARWFRFSALLPGLLVLTVSSSGFAQDVSVEAEVSAKKVALGSAVQLNITVHGDNNAAPVRLPDIEGFDVQYLGPSTRVSIVNGRYATSKTFVYSLFPLKEGRFQIPAIDVTAAGRTYTLQPITVEVVGSAQAAAPPSPDRPASLKDKIFVVLKVPKEEVYLNERLPVKILLFVSGLSARDIQYPELNSVGFTVGEYEEPRQYQQVADGVRYDVVEFNTEIYPTREGELRLGPARVACNLLVQSSSPAPFGRRGNIFDDDFFNSFFDRHEKRPMVLTSEEAAVNVLPLPAEGRPEDFSGAVGQFDFNVSVSPAEVKEGDPVTLRMTVIGKGNPAAVRMPSLPPGAPFKLYDPQIFEKDDIKKSEQVIIPQSAQVTEVPAIRFSYFNPQLKTYQTLQRGPFPLKVTKLKKEDEFKVVAAAGEVKPVQPEKLGRDIVFIKARPGKLRVAGRYVYNSSVFYAANLAAAVLWLAALMRYRRTRRIQTDIVYARRLQAPRQAKQGLAQARRLIASGHKDKFYDAVFKTLQQYLGNKLHLSSGAVTFEAVRARLSSRNIDQKVVDDIKSTFEECDMIRYASSDITRERMKAAYQRLTRIIEHLERSLR